MIIHGVHEGCILLVPHVVSLGMRNLSHTVNPTLPITVRMVFVPNCEGVVLSLIRINRINLLHLVERCIP